jgi:ABC-type branched-subunit amino acid transport system permease subunit
MDDKAQEQVLFASDNVAAAAPRLLVTYTSSANSVLPWWVWVAGIVVIAIIAFLAGWMITRRGSKKKALVEPNFSEVKK